MTFVEIEGRQLKLSNLEKVLYPEAGFTKGAVIDYYRRISAAVLPHLECRPLTLKRYPDGVEGEYFNETDGAVNPDNRFTLSVPIAPLPEGRYRVSYQVTSLGGSTFITGRYEFSIDLPEPRLELLEPVSGQGFESPRIPLEMRVHYFDFGQYNNRVHVYLDGEKVAEVQGESYVLEGVEPGVHELTTVLARFEEEELPDTAQTVTIAVGQPGSDRPAAEQASAPTGSEFGLGLENWPLVAALSLVLLGVGIWLGRSTQATPGPAPLAGEGEPPAS